MAWSESFAAQIDEKTQVLILGSMPGVKSLQENQYYAHKRNAFWPIMQSHFAIDATADYRQRLIELQRQHIGLWDVYGRCYRPGSLDSNIDKSRSQLNDFVALLEQCSNIHAIFFNGKAAETAFLKAVKPLLQQSLSAQRFDSLLLQGLPSTSPANAAMSFEQKLVKWQVVKEVLYREA